MAAVVAFPFTCITADDIDEDENPLSSFNSRQSRNGNPQETQSDEASDDATQASACSTSTLVGDADAMPVPSVVGNPAAIEDDYYMVESMNDSSDNMIDNAFYEELNDSYDDENKVSHNNDNNKSESNENDKNTEGMDEMEVETPSNGTARANVPISGYGGLINLGNSCYLGSALQMVASLDSFVENIKRIHPPSPNDVDDDKMDTSESDQSNLRQVFLGIMDSLGRGESVSPREFKRILDERTPLFHGFRQQDSHEFLTTLLDLLDEDYKRKPENKDSQGSEQPLDNTQTLSLFTGENYDDGEKGQAGEEGPPEEAAEAHDSEEAGENEEHRFSYESASMKARNLVVELSENATPSVETEPMNSCQTFSDLQPEEIERLIHARLLDTDQPASSPTAPKSRCKLVGGRMAAETDHGMLFNENTDVSMTFMSVTCDQLGRDETTECSAVSPVSPCDYLKTEVEVALTCESCKYFRSHTESFFHLSLEIISDINSVADGLRKFFSPEKREVKCEKCFCESAMQTMAIKRLPKALLLHFKRFIVDISDDYTSITYRKNQSGVFFEDTLELDEEKGGVITEFLAEDVVLPVLDDNGVDTKRSYKIRSVVNHIGSSVSCGHYTADAARLYPGGERQWTRFNDSYVSRVTADEAIKESFSTAYLVMYELS